MKTTIKLCLLAVLFCVGITQAGLQLVNSIAQIQTQIYNYQGSLILDRTGQINEYVNLAYWTGTEHYVRATNSITVSDDRQYISNKFYSNSFGFLFDYIFAYDSAITFKVDDNESGQQAIIVTAGDLYLNGSKLDREQDGSYKVPTSQELIAILSINRIAPQAGSYAYQRETAPLTTATQDIYLQGYTMPIPEPATMSVLGLASLGLYRRRA